MRTPLQQLIVEVWDVIRGGGIVLLGEVHDNPEHHLVREDILWPRLEPMVATGAWRPAAVFEHIRSDQQAGLDRFYDLASRSRRLWRANDLLARTRLGVDRLAARAHIRAACSTGPCGRDYRSIPAMRSESECARSLVAIRPASR